MSLDVGDVVPETVHHFRHVLAGGTGFRGNCGDDVRAGNRLFSGTRRREVGAGGREVRIFENRQLTRSRRGWFARFGLFLGRRFRNLGSRLWVFFGWRVLRLRGLFGGCGRILLGFRAHRLGRWCFSFGTGRLVRSKMRRQGGEVEIFLDLHGFGERGVAIPTKGGGRAKWSPAAFAYDYTAHEIIICVLLTDSSKDFVPSNTAKRFYFSPRQ